MVHGTEPNKQKANDEGRTPTVHSENNTRKAAANHEFIKEKPSFSLPRTEITLNPRMLLKQQQVKVGNVGGRKNKAITANKGSERKSPSNAALSASANSTGHLHELFLVHGVSDGSCNAPALKRTRRQTSPRRTCTSVWRRRPPAPFWPPHPAQPPHPRFHPTCCQLPDEK